jgi:hypothetical protein
MRVKKRLKKAEPEDEPEEPGSEEEDLFDSDAEDAKPKVARIVDRCAVFSSV